MSFTFHPSARAELMQAIDYYEACDPGLGYEFLEEIYACISRAVQYPDGWQRVSPRCHRCLTERFPYGVIYQIREKGIRILAIAHSHRRPGYWTDRSADGEG